MYLFRLVRGALILGRQGIPEDTAGFSDSPSKLPPKSAERKSNRNLLVHEVFGEDALTFSTWMTFSF